MPSIPFLGYVSRLKIILLPGVTRDDEIGDARARRAIDRRVCKRLAL